MANIYYNRAKKALVDADLDGNLPDDFRLLLLEASGDQDPDDATVQAVLARAGTTELTSAGYSRVAVTGEITNQNDTDDRAEVDADDAVFPGISQVGSETVVGYLLYKHVTDDTDSIPILMVDSFSPVPPNGSSITVSWNAGGIYRVE